MGKSKFFVLLLILALAAIASWVIVLLPKQQPMSQGQQNQGNIISGVCNVDADCPSNEECFGDEMNRCIDSSEGTKECICLYKSCNINTDCLEEHICVAREGDDFGKRCYYQEQPTDEDLDIPEDTRELLANSVEVEAFIRANLDSDVVLQKCNDEILVTKNDYDWDIICKTSEGDLNIVLGAYGDVVEFFVN